MTAPYWLDRDRCRQVLPYNERCLAPLGPSREYCFLHARVQRALPEPGAAPTNGSRRMHGVRRHFASRIDNALSRAGLDRDAVLAMTDRQVLMIPGVGVGSLAAVRNWALGIGGEAAQADFDWSDPERRDHAVLPAASAPERRVSTPPRTGCPYCGAALQGRTYLCRACGA